MFCYINHKLLHKFNFFMIFSKKLIIIYRQIFLYILIVFNLIHAKELQIGAKMPEVNHKLNNINSKKITLGQVKGSKGTLVIFSCNSCPWVIKWEDRYIELASSYLERGIGMIAVNSNVSRFEGNESLIQMKKHAEENNYNFPYAQDPKAKLAYAFGATKTPHIYLFDKNDNLVYRGAIDDNARDPNKVEETYLTDALDLLLAGKPIKKATSKAIGCSIKF